MAPKAKWQQERENDAADVVGGLSGTLKSGTCGRCGAKVLQGWEGHYFREPVTLDTRPLSTRGEAIALILVESTYRIIGRNPYPVKRTAYHINKYPADERHIVLPDHICGRTLPEDCYKPPPGSQTLTEPPF